MRSLWEDIVHALRLFVKSPGFTAVAVLTIALGIGANSTIFSWINSTMLNPIPGMKGSGEVVSLSLGGTSFDPRPFSYPDYLDLREHNKSFSGLIAADLRSLNLTGNKAPQRVWSTMCSANYFDVLGVQLMMGRNLRLFVADVARDADRSGPGAAGRVGVAVRDRRAGRRLESVIASLVTGCIY